MESPRIVSQAEWLSARKQLLEKEKAYTRLGDRLAAERRALPWVRVNRPYVFEGPRGPEGLADLFGGRSQLIVYHFMLAPGSARPCTGCCFLADHIDGPRVHLENHDVAVIVVSRAPLREIESLRRRMGWAFKWVSSHGNTFNSDFGVTFTAEDLAKGKTHYNYQERESQTEGEAPGISVFARDEAGDVFHTYSSYGRGGEAFLGTYRFLDLTPHGRREDGPHHNLMDWVKLHDTY